MSPSPKAPLDRSHQPRTAEGVFKGWPPEVVAAWREMLLTEGITRKRVREHSEATGVSKRTLAEWEFNFRGDPEYQRALVLRAEAAARARKERIENVTIKVMRGADRAAEIVDDVAAEAGAQIGAINALVRIRDSLVAEDQAAAKAAPDQGVTPERPDIVIVYPADVPTPEKKPE